MKYIIENDSGLPDLTAFAMIRTVIEQGKISNDGKQHCFITTFVIDEQKYMVYSMLNKNSERLVVTKSV